MKKIYLAFLLCLTAGFNQVYACEICGCGVGNFYLGMVPKFNTKFIGVRYRGMHYKSQMHDDPSEYSNDYYQTVEIWGGWNVSKKVQLMTFIPYQFSQRITDDGEKYSNGLGDITILTNFNFWNYSAGNINHLLWLGGGIKLPTGQYKIDFEDPDNNLGDPNSQAGTGSLDFIISINHTVALGKWGINTSTNYKMNTTNQDQYKFGNRFSFNTLGYYQFTSKAFSIAPVVGASYDQYAANTFYDINVDLTGGYVVSASAGMEVSYSNVALGITVQSPLTQNFAEHQTKAETRGLVHLTFTF